MGQVKVNYRKSPVRKLTAGSLAKSGLFWSNLSGTIGGNTKPSTFLTNRRQQKTAYIEPSSYLINKIGSLTNELNRYVITENNVVRLSHYSIDKMMIRDQQVLLQEARRLNARRKRLHQQVNVKEILTSLLLQQWFGEGDIPSHILKPQLNELKAVSAGQLLELIVMSPFMMKGFTLQSIRIDEAVLVRLQKRRNMLLAINEAEQSGAYEITEHLAAAS